MNIQSFNKGLIVSLIALASTQSYAANIDAAISSVSSTGQFDVNITKGDAVAITGLAAAGGLSISESAGATNPTGSITVCAFATTANYGIDINSATGGTAGFTATDGANLMPFSVNWSAGTDSLDFTTTAAAAQIGDSTQIEQSDPICGSGTNTTITVTVATTDFNSVPSGSYSETLDIIITAQ